MSMAKKKDKTKKKAYPSNKLGGGVLAPSIAKRSLMKAPAATMVSMSKCALRYALACSDPFAPAARGACVPVGSTATHKVHAFARFDVPIGVNGAAYIYVLPCIANDLPSIIHTTATYTGVGYPPGQPWASGTTFNVGWDSVTHNGPYNVSDICKGLAGSGTSFGSGQLTQGKIVSVGMRAQYVGTTLNESGLYYCYHAPTHDSVSGITRAVLGSLSETNIEAVTRMPCTLTMHAVTEDEMAFRPIAENANSLTQRLWPYCSGDNFWDDDYGSTVTKLPVTVVGTVGIGIGTPQGVIIITGVPGQVVHLESIFHFEYAGVAAASSVTDTTPDVIGANMVRTAALTLRQEALDKPHERPWPLMVSALKRVAKSAVKVGVPLLETALASMLV